MSAARPKRAHTSALDAVICPTRHVLTRKAPELLSSSEPRLTDQQAADILVEEGDSRLSQLAMPH
jgi:hypothetical protein